MKPRLLFAQSAFVGLLFIIACHSSKPAGEKRIDKALSRLNLTVVSEPDALAMIKHALDPKLAKDWAMGKMASPDIAVLAKTTSFQRMYFIRGNDLKTHEPKLLIALVFAPSYDTPPGQADIRYVDVTVCPPPDASTCLKDELEIEMK